MEFETEYVARKADHLLKHWGKVGKYDPQSLLSWLESNLRIAASDYAEDFVNPVKEVLQRVAAGESGPVIVRTR